MQLKLHWLLALACTSVALAAPQEPQKPPPKDPPRPAVPPGRVQPGQEKPHAPRPGEQKLDSALDELSSKVQQRRVDAADYERVRAALRERHLPGEQVDPRALARAKRIEQALDTFDQRNQNQKLTPAHVDMIREQLVDERLDQATERWRDAVAAGKVSDEEYRAVARQLARRAEVARSFDPEAGAMRTELQRRLEALQARAKDEPVRAEDVAEFRRELLDQRLKHAVANLERRAAEDDLTRAEFTRLRGLLEDHAVEAKDDDNFSSLQQRLNNALNELEQKVASGKVDPEEVGKLRATLIKHARAAGARTKPDAPPKK